MSRAPMRQCDECQFADMRAEELRCAHNHKPAFVQPGWAEIQSGEWGWMRRCRDFKAAEVAVPVPTIEQQQQAWRVKAFRTLST